jgi:hypothetical protein
MRVIATLAVLAAAGTANAAVFTSSAAFLPNLAPGFYLENFSGVVAGPAASLNFGPVNGYSYTVGTQAGAVSGLYNDPGLISHDNANDRIVVTFTGAPVTAIGGNFWSSDINFAAIPATVTLSLSDGTNEVFNSTSAADFRGFTSLVPITSMSIDASDTPTFAWSTMDNLYVGAAIPAPGSIALMGLGALVAGRRRR